MWNPRVFLGGVSALLAPVTLAATVSAAVPYLPNCYYVPQAGPVASPLEGSAAIPYFRTCPNNDGNSLPNNARIKIVVRDASGHGITGVAAADIVIVFNGGTPAQGFSGLGADSVIANSTQNPTCPDLRFLQADAPTDAEGATYITFHGADFASPGVGIRDAGRKWGHYDSELPVYVLGFKFSGRLTSTSANDSYTLRIKNLDWTGGLAAGQAGESVDLTDFNGVTNGIGIDNAVSYWKDFDSTNGVTAIDANLITTHLNHDCDTPNNP